MKNHDLRPVRIVAIESNNAASSNHVEKYKGAYRGRGRYEHQKIRRGDCNIGHDSRGGGHGRGRGGGTDRGAPDSRKR